MAHAEWCELNKDSSNPHCTCNSSDPRFVDPPTVKDAGKIAAKVVARGAEASLSKPEPPPKPNDRPAVWDLVRADFARFGFMPGGSGVGELVVEDMAERDRAGRAKYGTPLQPFNGRNALTDAYQEVLDLLVYLRQDIEEHGGIEDGDGDFRVFDTYRDAMGIAYRLRSVIRSAAG